MLTEVKSPFQYFTDTDGNPLEGGYIYIGLENLNPITSPKASYWDSALTIPAANIRTTIGYPAYGGSPGRLYVDGAYSILVKNSNEETIYLSLSMAEALDATSLLATADLASKKNSVEYGHFLGEVFPLMDVRVPTEWDPLDPASYFPDLCITNIDTYVDISTTNWPAASITYLRNLKVTYKDGLTGALTSYGVTNWAIAANVATLTFTNNADHIAFLNALLEDEASYGSYSNWRTITLASSIGDIAAGTYALTNVNSSSRTVSFAFVAGNNSGAVTATAEFYANRIPGSTTTARVFSARGRAIHGAGDDNGYMINGLARRGFMQDHAHNLSYFNIGGASGGTGLFFSNAADSTIDTPNNHIGGPIAKGTSGTSRASKDTNSPAFVTLLYLHLGSYTA